MLKRLLGFATGTKTKVQKAAEKVCIPVGFANYTAADFASQFNIDPIMAQRVAMDYAALFSNGSAQQFGAAVAARPRDLAHLSDLIASRYGLVKENAVPISRFFSMVAIAREAQRRMVELSITKAAWVSLEGVPFACHSALSGTEFNPQIGLRTEGEFVLPATRFDCQCFYQVKLDF
ncbi:MULTISPECIES: hypothetical protein [Ralstonia]|jgi:hypothetical protein|uniref:Phage head morphogenesis domain-containing protein n=2 Tax=Ralstonia pickettii TaxID=329 RepID=R0E9I4_RALPI|nr:hypothetical protein [Ralstonia pickettii]ENZ78057.1 hypothetical protein OR214_02333 [Ralstonia pickettii OR214]MCM3581856.1 hypothetical protein [Ralstonia pickettii]